MWGIHIHACELVSSGQMLVLGVFLYPSPLCLQAESLPMATLAGQISLWDLELHASLTFFMCSGIWTLSSCEQTVLYTLSHHRSPSPFFLSDMSQSFLVVLTLLFPVTWSCFLRSDEQYFIYGVDAWIIFPGKQCLALQSSLTISKIWGMHIYWSSEPFL